MSLWNVFKKDKKSQPIQPTKVMLFVRRDGGEGRICPTHQVACGWVTRYWEYDSAWIVLEPNGKTTTERISWKPYTDNLPLVELYNRKSS
jgi:hypothetical protein